MAEKGKEEMYVGYTHGLIQVGEPPRKLRGKFYFFVSSIHDLFGTRAFIWRMKINVYPR